MLLWSWFLPQGKVFSHHYNHPMPLHINPHHPTNNRKSMIQNPLLSFATWPNTCKLPSSNFWLLITPKNPFFLQVQISPTQLSMSTICLYWWSMLLLKATWWKIMRQKGPIKPFPLVQDNPHIGLKINICEDNHAIKA